MNKASETANGAESAPDAIEKKTVKFKDAAFKSRVVILPDGRSLRIERSYVAVDADDAAALAALRRDPSFIEVSEG